MKVDLHEREYDEGSYEVRKEVKDALNQYCLYDHAKCENTNENNAIRVDMRKHSILLSNKKNNVERIVKEIKHKDFIGVDVQKEDKSGKNYIKFYFFEPQQKGNFCCKKSDPQYKQVYNNSQKYYMKGNKEKEFTNLRDVIMQEWIDNRKAILGIGIPADDPTYVHDPKLKSWQKKVLVIANPNSGYKESIKTYNEYKEIFRISGFECKLVETKSKEDCIDFVKIIPHDEFKSFYMMIIFGGDGTLHDCMNGFYQRPDKESLNFRFGIVASGSGNGAAFYAGLTYGLETKFSIPNSVYAQTRLKFNPISVSEVECEGVPEKIYSFHNIGIGFTANIVNVKKNNYSGGKGYKLALKDLLVNPKSIKGKLDICIPKNPFPSKGNIKEIDSKNNYQEDNQWVSFETEFYNIIAVHYPELLDTCQVTDRIKLGSPFGDVCINIVNPESGPCKDRGIQSFQIWSQLIQKRGKMVLKRDNCHYELFNSLNWTFDESVADKDCLIELDGELVVSRKMKSNRLTKQQIFQACENKELK